jgi:hypothetical protein
VSTRSQHGRKHARPASLLVAASLLALALAPPAQAKPRFLRFDVSVKGQQTATWSTTLGETGCTTSRRGRQTISFESPRPGRLSLRRFPRTDPKTGKRRGFAYIGIDAVPANWTFTRAFQESTSPSCPPPAEVVSFRASDCGTKGPFAVPVSIGWRGGAVELRGVLGGEGQRAPDYKTCEYEAYHQQDLIDSKGRLSQRKLTSRRQIRVKVSASEKQPAAEGGSQTTTLVATVTLRRVR